MRAVSWTLAVKRRLQQDLQRYLDWSFFFWLFNDLQQYARRAAANALC
jgi:hypothetical protein